jgi:Flp pilus assembly protein TadG
MLCRSHLSDQNGSVTPIFALALLPMFALVGAAVDYSTASRIRTKLLNAADSATVSSVSQSSVAYNTATTMNGDGPIPAGVTDATNTFNANIQGATGVSAPSLTVTVEKSKGSVISTVQFSTTVQTMFMGVLGIRSINVAGTSTAQNDMPVFIDFYLLLDNTPSMGVAATPADVTKMVNNTPDQCAFACHDLSNPNNYYDLAKALGVTTRIDVLRSATQQLMDTAGRTETYSNQYRMAIYTFGSDASSTSLNTITPLTSSLSSAKTAAANIDLMTVPYQNYNNDQDTNYDSILPAINNIITTPGNGSSSSAPQKFLFFVSDGVADEYNPTTCSQPTTGGRCQEPIDISLCQAIKTRGVKIAVLYTTYLPLPTNNWYNTWIAPFSSSIAANMQNCATPGFYFEVSPTQGISDAMNALFQRAVATARLSK